MVRYSVIVPQRDAAEMFARRLPELIDALTELDQPLEIVCVDDRSDGAGTDLLLSLLADHPSLRVVQLDRRGGLDAALAAGIEAASGEVVVIVEAGERYSYEDVPRLIERLSRADFVCGCRRGGRLRKLWRAVVQLPRTLLLGRLVHDPTCLFWAARREAVAGLELTSGMWRFLPWLVALRGYRVGQLNVDHRWHAVAPRLVDDWPSPGNLLTVWWQTRRARPRVATELGVPQQKQQRRDADGRLSRIDPPQPTVGRRPPSVGVTQHRHDNST